MPAMPPSVSPAGLAVGVVVVLALLTFVPSRYLYPSQPGLLNVVSNVLGAIWAAMLVGLLAMMLPGERAEGMAPIAAVLAWASLFYPAFYLVASWVVTIRIGLREREAERSAVAG